MESMRSVVYVAIPQARGGKVDIKAIPCCFSTVMMLFYVAVQSLRDVFL